MNNEQISILGKAVTEATLEFLAAKHSTTTQVVADQIAAGQGNIVRQFHQLMDTGLRDAIDHFMNN